MNHWTERIPAAIERAKGIVERSGEALFAMIRSEGGADYQDALTRGEVALAEALSDSTCSKFVLGAAEQTGMMYCQDTETCTRHRALRAFTEKIESL